MTKCVKVGENNVITDGFVLHDYFVFWWCCSEVLITYLVRSQEVFLGATKVASENLISDGNQIAANSRR